MKTNEIQLRKFFMNIVSWSERVFPEHECGYKFPHYRKIILMKIVFQLSETMTSLFTPFFHFIFDTQIAQLNQFAALYSSLNPLDLLSAHALNRKRKREEPTDALDSSTLFHHLSLKLVSLNLAALKSCFQNDKEGFIDTNRFQALIEPLLSLFDAFHFNIYSDYISFIDTSLIPIIIALFILVGQDYKWKTLNYSVNSHKTILIYFFNPHHSLI